MINNILKAAGSGSESSCKINDFNGIKNKSNFSGNLSQIGNIYSK